MNIQIYIFYINNLFLPQPFWLKTVCIERRIIVIVVFAAMNHFEENNICLTCETVCFTFSPETDKTLLSFSSSTKKICRECYNSFEQSRRFNTLRFLELRTLCSKCNKEEYICIGCRCARIAAITISIRNPDTCDIYCRDKYYEAKLCFKKSLIRKFFLRNALIHMRYVFATLTTSDSMPKCMDLVRKNFLKNEEHILELFLYRERDYFEYCKSLHKKFLSTIQYTYERWERDFTLCRMNSYDRDKHVHYGYIEGYAIMNL